MLTLQYIFIIVITIIIIVVILFIYLFIYFHFIAYGLYMLFYTVWTFICGDILKTGNASTGCDVEDS